MQRMLTDVPLQNRLLRGIVLSLILVSSVISNLGEYVEGILIIFAGNMKLGRIGSMLNDRYKEQIVAGCLLSIKIL